MLNMLVIGTYAPFCAVTAVILGIELLRPYKRKTDRLFTLLCFCAFGWYVVNIGGLLTNNVETARFCINFMLVFVSLIAPTLLLFILDFYGVRLPFQVPKYAPLLLYIVPAITCVVILTAPYHSLLNTVLEFPSLSPVREMEVVWGPWFWVHTVYSYILSAIIIILIVVQHVRVPRFYRVPSTMMVLGVSMTLLGNLVTLLQIIPPVIEPTLISMSLSLIFFSLAIFNNNKSKFVRFSKSHIYHYLAEYILVLDEKNQVIDFNRAAGEWFASEGIELTGSTLESVTAALLTKGEYTGGGDASEKSGVDITLRDTMFPLVLNQRIYDMKDTRGDSIGRILVFSNVTENRKLIEQLETRAGIDSLTSLSNHRAYVGAKNRLDAQEHLPLGVIMGDANQLKHVNDTMGHNYGDAMLQAIAGVLESACPKGGFVARLGGDEFILLLPQTGQAVTEALAAQLEEQLAAITTLPFPVSVAFGVSVKTSMQESLDEVIALADQRMYENKNKTKAEAAKQK